MPQEELKQKLKSTSEAQLAALAAIRENCKNSINGKSAEATLAFAQALQIVIQEERKIIVDMMHQESPG